MTNGGIRTTDPGTGVSIAVADNVWPDFLSTSLMKSPVELWCGVVS